MSTLKRGKGGVGGDVYVSKRYFFYPDPDWHLYQFHQYHSRSCRRWVHVHCKCLFSSALVRLGNMAPHLTPQEQDKLIVWMNHGCTPIEIHKKLYDARSH